MQPQPKSALNRILEKIRANKKLELAVYAAALLLAVGIYFLTSQKKPATETYNPNLPEQTQSDNLETRLENLLSGMRGVGRVQVLITYESSGELVTATGRQTDESLSESSGNGNSTRSEQTREVSSPATITVNGVQQPIILYEKEPVIRGVVVVAQGAGDPFVRMNIERAIRAATGVPITKIEIFEMKWDD
ncbi:MAG: hypothetical protein FWF10_11110 [Clostridiales bacterium]|nr:hypothetical protein [Clostridiales bacterium]